MAILTQEQFAETFGEKAERLTSDEPPPFDFWPYFDTIPTQDFRGHDCSAGRVEYVYRMRPTCFEHVLVKSEHRNIFMVLVLDREAGEVYGHRLLDLNREYRLDA
jgi:hypothetical protein